MLGVDQDGGRFFFYFSLIPYIIVMTIRRWYAPFVNRLHNSHRPEMQFQHIHNKSYFSDCFVPDITPKPTEKYFHTETDTWQAV